MTGTWTTLDRYWSPSSSNFYFMLQLSDFKWTHAHLKTPLWWGPQKNNQGLRKLRHHPDGFLVSSLEWWPLNWEFLEKFLTRCLIVWFLYQAATTNRGIYVMVAFEAVEHFSLPDWLIFADGDCLWCPEGCFLIIICTGLAMPYTYEQQTRKLRLPARCEVVM